MIRVDQFNKYAREFADWITQYYKEIEKYPVKSQVKPGDIFDLLPSEAPQKGESIDHIFDDFKSKLLPGITHWQSPNFFAYFPADSSFPSILAEMLTAALGVQGMKWDTSPAATELEEKVINWLKKMTGIPAEMEGCIQDTASTSTLAAILTAREKATGFKINEQGMSGMPQLRVYASAHGHSSIDKAVKIAGLGIKNLVKIPVDSEFRMIPAELEKAIQQDKAKGYLPVCVIASVGTTSTTSIDPVGQVAAICHKENAWLHVDAAYAGSALILPEFQWMVKGIEKVDSLVFNPHKWLFTNFDCSVLFVRDKQALLNTFQLIPEYLKTGVDNQVNNYSDWGIQLGRRFRALKLWFVIRNFGVQGLQGTLRKHIALGEKFESWVKEDPDFQLMAPRTLNLICFRYFHPSKSNDELDQINHLILDRVNKSGKMYITHTKLNEVYTIRFVASQTYVEEHHIMQAWKHISEVKNSVIKELNK